MYTEHVIVLISKLVVTVAGAAFISTDSSIRCKYLFTGVSHAILGGNWCVGPRLF